MNCIQVRENLSAYLDGQMSLEEINEIEKHLAACPDCRKELQQIKEVVRQLASMEEVIPPALFRHGLRKKLEQKEAEQGSSFIENWRNIFKNFNRRRWFSLAVTFVLLLLIVPFASNYMPQAVRVGGSSDSVMNDQAPAAGIDESYRSTKEQEALVMPASAPSMPTVPTPDSTGYMPDLTQVFERKIIKNADIMIQVDNYSEAAEAIEQKVMLAGGYISSENMNNYGEQENISGYIQVRLPADKFDAFIAGLEELGTIKSRNIYTQDVTEEYVDVESQLKAMRTKEERLLSILEESGSLSDILEVEKELANTRSQLESLEGRLRYLDNRTDYSSIGINIQQVTASSQQIKNPGFGEIISKAKEAFIKAVNNILILLSNILIFFGALLPYLIILLILAIIVVPLLWMKRNKKN